MAHEGGVGRTRRPACGGAGHGDRPCRGVGGRGRSVRERQAGASYSSTSSSALRRAVTRTVAQLGETLADEALGRVVAGRSPRACLAPRPGRPPSTRSRGDGPGRSRGPARPSRPLPGSAGPCSRRSATGGRRRTSYRHPTAGPDSPTRRPSPSAGRKAPAALARHARPAGRRRRRGAGGITNRASQAASRSASGPSPGASASSGRRGRERGVGRRGGAEAKQAAT